MGFKKLMGYIREDEVHVEIIGTDIRNDNYIIAMEEEGQENTYVVAYNDIEVFEELCEIGGKTVYDKDVLKHKDGELRQIESLDNGRVRLNLLGDNLEIISSGAQFSLDSNLERLNELFTDVLGNIYVLEKEYAERKPDFKVQIVKTHVNKPFGGGSHYIYYYACNNEDDEMIDLISACFVGVESFDKIDYSRTTISHDDYMGLVASGDLELVSEDEFRNYVTGVTYEEKGADDKTFEELYAESKNKVFDTNVLDEPCKDCNRPIDDCDCDLW